MRAEITLLIADRNPNVRNFLKRELAKDGYLVITAKNGQEVVRWAYHPGSPQLLIVDPDFPDMKESSVLIKIRDRLPALPVILYTDIESFEICSKILDQAVFLEKRENNVEDLKKMVLHILQNASPQSRTDN